MKPLPAATTSRPFASSLVALVVISVGLTAATGCTHVRTESFARLPRWTHPTMARTDMTSSAEAHIRSVNEGAAGGSGGTQSGCGCN
jgi:hypothetical protein